MSLVVLWFMICDVCDLKIWGMWIPGMCYMYICEMRLLVMLTMILRWDDLMLMIILRWNDVDDIKMRWYWCWWCHCDGCMLWMYMGSAGTMLDILGKGRGLVLVVVPVVMVHLAILAIIGVNSSCYPLPIVARYVRQFTYSVIYVIKILIECLL